MLNKSAIFHLFAFWYFFFAPNLLVAEPNIDLKNLFESNSEPAVNPAIDLAILQECTPTSTPFCINMDTVTVGSNVCLSLTTQNYTDVLAFQFGLSFDTTILLFESIEIFGPLSDLDETDFSLDSTIIGRLSVAYLPDDAVSSFTLEDGIELVQICFTALAVGESDLAFIGDQTPLIVANSNLEELPFDSGDGQITVITCMDAETQIDTTICVGQSIIIGNTEYAAAGIYTNILPTFDGCDSTITLNLAIAEIGYSVPETMSVCPGEAASITVPDGFMIGLTSPISQTIILPIGSHTVIVRNIELGCEEMQMIDIIENQLPIITITGDLSFCEGNQTMLTASGTTTYLWNTGATTMSISINQSGIFSVTGTDENGCSATTEVEITVHPLPNITFQGETQVCSDELVLITASGGSSYAWSGGENPSTAANLLGQGTYTVTVTDGNDCENTAEITIEGDSTMPDIVYCPPSLLLYINAGETSTNVTWAEPLVEDNCNDFINISASHTSGDIFNLGTTTVTYTATDGGGNTASCSFDITIEESAPLTFFVDTLNYTSSNDTFLVPIGILDFDQVIAFQYTITAPDIDLSEIIDIQSTGVLDGSGTLGGIIAQVVDENTIQIIWIDETGQGITLADSTAIFNVVLKVTAPFGSCVPLEFSSSPLDIEAFQQLEGTVRPTVRNGDICVNKLVDIVGEIYRTDNSPINRVEVNLMNTDLDLADTTDIAGRYDFLEQMGDEDYTITPERDFDHPEGLSITDLVMMIQHITGVNLIGDPYLLIAGDINNDQFISVSDILEAREIILNNITEFPSNTSWRFIPVEYTFPQATNPWFETFPESEILSGQEEDVLVDFYGIKIGDLNLSASTQFAPDGTLNLQVDDQIVQQGQTVNVGIYAKDLSNIGGIQWGLSFDKNLEFINIASDKQAKANDLNDLQYRHNEKTGELSLVWLNNHRTSSNEIITEIQFKVNKTGLLSDFLQLQQSSFINEAATKEAVSMAVKLHYNQLDGSTISSNKALDILSCSPNPFSKETSIRFELKETDNLTFQVFDMNGKLIISHKERYESGIHNWVLNATDLTENGIYLVQIQGSIFLVTTRICKQ